MNIYDLPNPLVALPMVTPFNEKGGLDLDSNEFNLDKWKKTEADIFIVGTASGEELLITEEEKILLLQRVSGSLPNNKISAAGIDNPSPKETLKLAEKYAKSGASLLRIRYPRDESIITNYFLDVLKNTPLPVLLMHQGQPLNFGVAPKPVASPEILGRIASMENVFGYVTEHDMRFESTVRNYVPEEKRFWICNGSMILLGTLIGCNGTTTAFSNIWPDALKELLKIGIKGEFEKGKILQNQIKEIDNLMLPYLYVGIKYCLSLMGFKGMVSRDKNINIPDEVKYKISETLELVNLI